MLWNWTLKIIFVKVCTSVMLSLKYWKSFLISMSLVQNVFCTFYMMLLCGGINNIATELSVSFFIIQFAVNWPATKVRFPSWVTRLFSINSFSIFQIQITLLLFISRLVRPHSIPTSIVRQCQMTVIYLHATFVEFSLEDGVSDLYLTSPSSRRLLVQSNTNSLYS